MTKQDYIKLFSQIKPGFFERDYVKNREDEDIFDEMILCLKDFDPAKYVKQFGPEVSFDYFKGDINELKAQIIKVDESWPQWFNENQTLFCGYIDGKVACFCMIEDFGTYEIDGKQARVGGPGCVGTVPEFRNKGLGLTMVNKATQIAKELGYDYSYIHYTGVPGWYAKLGYETIFRWNKHGVL